MDIAFSRRGQVRPDLLPACARFISWRAGTIDALGMQKVPCDEHGNKVDATDPRYWCSWGVAAARGWGVAVVMGTVDPETGLRVSSVDLDDAWGADGQLRPLAAEAWQVLSAAGAYMERSVSGRGIHAIGLSDLPEGHAVKRKSAPGLEVYSERRFLILGDYLGGDGRVNVSQALRGLMQRHGLPLVVERAEIEEGRSEKWAGPEDDNELIRIMLDQGLRGKKMFEHGAVTVAQLWELDEAALGQQWPASGRTDGKPFAHSEVDAAIMSHLAYFTGHDQPRMVRLFERWKGYRPHQYEGKGAYRLERVLGLGLRTKNCYFSARYAAQAVAPLGSPGAEAPKGVLGDFYAHLPDRTFYHRPTGAFWPVGTIDDILPPVVVGTKPGGTGELEMKASKWLARHAGVHQRSWVPGWPEVIDGWVMADGVLMEQPGNRILNTYKAPTPPQSQGGSPEPWLAHIRFVYPTDAEYMLDWMAFVAQNAAVKVNHAIVVGGGQGIGKDSMLAPLMRAVGEQNWRETTPETILTSQFNPYLMARVLRINEAKDTGGESRFQFYDRTKTIITAPPNVHVINNKGVNPFQIPNLNATIITTNYRTGGLYLVRDDRRHYVMFSDATREQFSEEYWRQFHAWMAAGGLEECAHYLMTRDVSRFDPKAPPPKTPAFWEMCESGQASQVGGLADLLEGREVVAANQLVGLATTSYDNELAEWLKSSKNATALVKALNDLGWTKISNPHEVRGRWVVRGTRTVLYAPQRLTPAQRMELVRQVCTG